MTKNIPRWRLTFTFLPSGESFRVLIQRQSFIYFVGELRCIKTKQPIYLVRFKPNNNIYLIRDTAGDWELNTKYQTTDVKREMAI